MDAASFRRVLVLSIFGTIACVTTPAAQTAARIERGERHIDGAIHVPEGVPIEVRSVSPSPGGIAAALVNVASHPIVAYEVRLVSQTDAGPPRLHAVQSGSGLAWQPGVETVVILRSQPLAEGARVVPTAAILADGSRYGDAAALERFGSEWRDRYAGLTGVLAVLAEGPTPTMEEDLQALIDRVAVAMARVPGGRSGTGVVEQPYAEAVSALKRLRGRDMVGTERFDRELQDIRSRLQRELDERRKTPALLDAIR